MASSSAGKGAVAVTVLLAILAAVGAPFFLGESYGLHLMIVAGIFAVLASSLSLIVGFAGLLSLGHAAFFGLGAYTSALLYLNAGIPMWGGLAAAFFVSGIAAFLIVAALMLVANTIRLAAFARRREIGIMRLVGASSLYISLPFLLEALVTALVGVVLAGGLTTFLVLAARRVDRVGADV